MIKQTNRASCPFRSITDLKSYDDNENIKGPSLTDTSQYVPIDVMIKTMTQQEYNWHKVNSGYVSDFELENNGLSGITEIEDLTDLVTQYESTSPEMAQGTEAFDGDVPSVGVNKNEVVSNIEQTPTDSSAVGEPTIDASSPTSVNQL